MFSRKADGGLSMNFVVMLAISLIVMIVVIGIFVGRSSDGNRNLRACESQNGYCLIGHTFCPPNHANASTVRITGALCYEGNTNNVVQGNYVCCVRRMQDES